MTISLADCDIVRDGEKNRTWYRSERIFKNRLGWYFRTREGIDVGPFGCRFDAEVDLESLIRQLQASSADKALQAVHAQAVTAGSPDYLVKHTRCVDYLVEEGGVELLKDRRAG